MPYGIPYTAPCPVLETVWICAILLCSCLAELIVPCCKHQSQEIQVKRKPACSCCAELLGQEFRVGLLPAGKRGNIEHRTGVCHWG